MTTTVRVNDTCDSKEEACIECPLMSREDRADLASISKKRRALREGLEEQGTIFWALQVPVCCLPYERHQGHFSKV